MRLPLGADRRADVSVHLPARARAGAATGRGSAVLAALLVAYEPMYGFISGIVNNDVGVNADGGGAGAAADPPAASWHHDPLGRAHRRGADPAAERQGHRPLAVSRWRRWCSWWRCGATTAAPTCWPGAALALAARGRRRARDARALAGVWRRARPTAGGGAPFGDRHERQRGQRSAAPHPGLPRLPVADRSCPRLPFMTDALPAGRLSGRS